MKHYLFEIGLDVAGSNRLVGNKNRFMSANCHPGYRIFATPRGKKIALHDRNSSK